MHMYIYICIYIYIFIYILIFYYVILFIGCRLCRRPLTLFSQTLNSIGWHHSSNQRNVLHVSIVSVFIITTSQIWPKNRPRKNRVGRLFSFFTKIGIPGFVFEPGICNVFFSYFENVLIPQNLILPSITSWTPLSKIWKKTWNPRYCFFNLGFASFFSDFWNVRIPPILSLPSITSRIHFSQKTNHWKSQVLFLNLELARFCQMFEMFEFRQSRFYLE